MFSRVPRRILGNVIDRAYDLFVITIEHSPVCSDPELMGGTLVFRQTRVPAQTLLDYLSDGFTLEEFLDMFPSVAREDAVEFLQLAQRTAG